MWATTASQPFLPTPIRLTSFPKLLQPPTETFSVVQLRRIKRFPAVVATAPQDISGLGQAIFSTLKSGPPAEQNSSNKVQQEEQPKKGKEVSGSDILRALQKASAKKATAKKQQQKKKGSGDPKRREKKVIDYGKVRPLTIKSDWAARLDDLEKRLQEFSTL